MSPSYSLTAANVRGLAWSEFRLASLESSLALVLVVASQAALKAAESGPSLAEGDGSLAMAFVVLPMLALLLGAGVLRSLPVLRRLPLPAVATASLFVSFRLLLLGLLALTWVAVAPLVGLSWSSDLRPPFVVVCVIGMLVGAMVAACFTVRPLNAVLLGVVLGNVLIGPAVLCDATGGKEALLVMFQVLLGLAFLSWRLRGGVSDLPARRQAGRVLAFAAALLSVVLVIYEVGARTIAWQMTRSARAKLEGLLPSGADLLARHPSVPTNATGRRLEALTRELGFEIQSKSELDTSAKLESERFDVKKWKHESAQYIDAVTRDVDVPLAAPSPYLLSFLSEAEGELESIRELLLSEEGVVWTERLEDGWEAPMPNLLGNIVLSKLLLTDALVASMDGLWQRTERNLAAVAALERTLTVRVELISQLIAMAEAKMRLRVLRRMPFDDLVARAADTDLDASLAWELDTLLTYSFDDDASSETFWLARPYQLVSMRRAALNIVEFVEERDATGGCSTDATFGATFNPYVSIPNLAMSGRRQARMLLEAELSERVMRLRRGESWSEALAQSACSEVTWLHESMDDGGFSIRLKDEFVPISFSARREPPLRHRELGSL